MLIIPELETVVILVPRTGSGSLYRAILDRYPRAMMPYRHMEADGVPFGYDRWRRLGVVRNPLARLWSLYCFLQARSYVDAGQESGKFHSVSTPAYLKRCADQVALPFDRWVVENQEVFTGAHDDGRFWPQYAVHHPMPENRKSQFVYLRPDLGTQIYRYDSLSLLAAVLDVELPRRNATGQPLVRSLVTPVVMAHMQRVFGWDFEAVGAWEDDD